MLPHVPEIYPEELVYSVCARLRRRLGLSATRTAMALFGSSHKAVGITLPTNLAAFASRVPGAAPDLVSRLVHDHTLFPYFAALTDEEEAGRALTAMRGGGTGAVFFQAMGRTVRMSHALAFCPECSKEMLQKHGELYWCRDHHLPGAYVCARHRTALRVAKIATGATHLSPVAATPAICGDDAPSMLAGVEEGHLDFFVGMAEDAVGILHGRSFPKRDQKLWRVAFQQECGTKSLLSRKGANLPATRQAVRDGTLPLRIKALRTELGRSLAFLKPVLPHLFDGDRCGSWVTRLCMRDQGRHVNAIWRHVAMEGVRAMERRQGLFPAPPWPCHNPIAPHAGREIVLELAERNRTGRFTCRCGYVYTRTIDREGRMSAPRVKHWGPLLPIFVAWAHGIGASMGVVERCSGIHKARVREAAERLGLGPWPYRTTSELSLRDFHAHLDAHVDENERSLFYDGMPTDDVGRAKTNEH